VKCLFAAGVLVLAAGCGSSTQRPAAAAQPPFLFADRQAPLGIVDRPSASGHAQIRVRDVSFGGRRERVNGYLALPAKSNGRVASVILLHGTGGSRSDFLPYAKKLAARGFAALTLTAPSASAQDPPPGLSPRAQLRRQQQLSADDVVAVRRAVDFLDTRASIDPHRIGLVGWSAGARTGAVVAGVEPRIRTFVLMSAGAVPVSDYAKIAPPALRPEIRSVLGSVDPLRWIARARRGTIFLQDGLHDEVVPKPALLAMAHAAPVHTRLRWYRAGHPLNLAANRDQLTWLEQRLAAT
jgi:dienelactone hydrolase